MTTVPKTMRAAVMTGLHRVEIRQVPVPAVPPNHVLVRIRACGVCGSDVHYFHEGRIGDQVVKGPQVLGHEPAGDVAAVGRGVRRVREGDRVAVEPAFNCKRCVYCRRGQANLCTNLLFLGMPGLPGAFQEYLAVPAHCVEIIPPQMPYAIAALLEPLAIAVHATHLVPDWKGARVAILGAGPIGLSILLCVRAAGASRIFVSEPIAERRYMARRLGARIALDPTRENVPDRLLAATRGLGVDIAIEAAGVPEAWHHAIDGTRKGGRILIAGIPEVDFVPVPAHTARRKELVIQNVRRSNRDLARTIDLVKTAVDPSALHTHTFSLEETGKALELVQQKADGVVKAIIEP